jgi:hypothetical protein
MAGIVEAVAKKSKGSGPNVPIQPIVRPDSAGFAVESLQFSGQPDKFYLQSRAELFKIALGKVRFVGPRKQIPEQRLRFGGGLSRRKRDRGLHLPRKAVNRLHDSILAPVMAENYTRSLAEKSGNNLQRGAVHLTGRESPSRAVVAFRNREIYYAA